MTDDYLSFGLPKWFSSHFRPDETRRSYATWHIDFANKPSSVRAIAPDVSVLHQNWPGPLTRKEAMGILVYEG